MQRSLRSCTIQNPRLEQVSEKPSLFLQRFFTPDFTTCLQDEWALLCSRQALILSWLRLAAKAPGAMKCAFFSRLVLAASTVDSRKDVVFTRCGDCMRDVEHFFVPEDLPSEDVLPSVQGQKYSTS